MKRIVVIGGGAAGFFSALAAAEKNPGYQITILEKSSTLLSKVKISGGGRCNVTHACFEPRELVKNYPRGEKQLLGPFTRFHPAHTVEWFESRGVELKTEEDGRMFLVSDSSETIIRCFLSEADRLGVNIKMQSAISSIIKEGDLFKLTTDKQEIITADAVIITTGSSASMWDLLSAMGHTIVPPVASLFTFQIRDERIRGLSGISVTQANIELIGHPRIRASGPLLITHWGMSGPAVLRLSAWGARTLAELKYRFEISVNWTGGYTLDRVKEMVLRYRKEHPKKSPVGHALFGIPKRLWEQLTSHDRQPTARNYADLSNQQIHQLAETLTTSRFAVTGKSTYKDEFVTAGGVALDEVDFKTMQSKKIPGLYFAGEVLDIDAITGGFNFQAAWTAGWIAGSSV